MEEIVKLESKDFEALVKKLGDQGNEKINDLFTKSEQGNKQAIGELKETIKQISEIDGKSISVYVKALQDHTNKLEEQLVGLKDAPRRKMSFMEALETDLKKAMPEAKKAFDAKQPMELKTVGDMSMIDNYGSGTVPLLYLPGITGIAKRRTALYDVLNKVPWASDTVNYVENSGGEGTIAAKLENAATSTQKFTQKDYDFVKRYMTLSKIPAYAKVTREMMENSDNIVSFIQNELVRDVLIKLEDDILTGNGTGAVMKGLQHSDHYTAAAIPGSFTLDSGVNAHEVHVLRAIITQMQNLYFNPGIILMHPTDTMRLDLSVDENGQFIIPPFANRDNTTIKGVPIVEFAGLTAGYFHIIDPTRVNLYIQRGLNVRLWDQVGDDPLYDLMTITASVKAGVLVKYNEKGANIYGDFASLIAALETT